MEVPANYTPRDYQAEFLANAHKYWFIVMMWARRGGKGLTTFVYAIQRMVEEPMGVVIVYPTGEQGYRSFWNNIENDGFRTIEHIPDELIASKTSTRDSMSIVLKNGSTLDLIGSNADPEKLRGNNIKLYILSEFVDIDSSVLDIIEPIVIANGGQIIVESTPKQDGISGMTFIRLLKAAEKDAKQLASRVPATNYMNAEQLDRARQSCITKWGNDFMYRQEYLLDEGQALETSYYGNIITAKEKSGRIAVHPYDPMHPVYTSWDLGGGGDSTAGVFWQYYNRKLVIIDAHETHVINDQLLIKYINALPYAGNYGYHFFPHDGSKRDSDGIQRIVKMKQMGLPNATLLRKRRKEAGLVDAIELMAKASVFINSATTMMTNGLVEKLRLYRRKFNPYTGDYEGPDHTTASHYADAIRYMSDAILQFFDAKTGAFLIRDEPLVTVSEYYDPNSVSWNF